MIKEIIKITKELKTRGLTKEATTLVNIVKSSASTAEMIDYDLRYRAEQEIASLLLAEAKRRANRSDFSKEMYMEFYDDAQGDVAKLLNEMTESIKSFNMDATLLDEEPLPELDDPTELDEDSGRYNPNKPWDALFPPSKE
tara:strand:- start:303 stop:725 length:423 start_codon:yes stop_codon:yes gene_type:complete